MVVNEEVVFLFVVGFLVVFDTLAEALKTERSVFIRRAVEASDLDTFLNAAFTD
jgi:hypothetical protein